MAALLLLLPCYPKSCAQKMVGKSRGQCQSRARNPSLPCKDVLPRRTGQILKRDGKRTPLLSYFSIQGRFLHYSFLRRWGQYHPPNHCCRAVLVSFAGTVHDVLERPNMFRLFLCPKPYQTVC